MKVIGVYGTMRSGKSVVCEGLPNVIMINTGRVRKIHHCSLSTHIKAVTEIMTGVKQDDVLNWIPLNYNSWDSVYDYSATLRDAMVPTFDMTIGSIMQKIGIGMKESMYKEVWMDKVLSSVPISADVVVIDGVRFEEDVKEIIASGGKIIRVRRSDEEYSDMIAKQSRDPLHITETALSGADGCMFDYDYVNEHSGSRQDAVESFIKWMNQQDSFREWLK